MHKPLAKYGCVTGKIIKQRRRGGEGFGAWRLPKETGEDRWKIIREGWLIRCGGGRKGGREGDGRTAGFSTARERTAKSN